MAFFFRDIIEEEQRIQRLRDARSRRDREEQLEIEKMMYPDRFIDSEQSLSPSKLEQLLNKDQSESQSAAISRQRPITRRGKVIDLSEYRLRHLR